MARITQVPTELLFMTLVIGDGRLTIHNVVSVARTCRALHSVATAVLFRHNISHDRSSVMIWASQNNEPETLKKALAFGADVNTVGSSYQDADDQYGTPLHYAAMSGYDEVVRLLLDHNAKLDGPSMNLCMCHPAGYPFYGHDESFDHSTQNKLRWYPLHLAICSRHETTAHLIMERHPPFQMRQELPDSVGDAPTIIHCATARGLDTVLQRALTLYPGILETRSSHSSVTSSIFPLHYTAYCLHSKSVIKTLISAGCDLEAEDEDNMTPIWRACKVGNFDTAMHLLAEGAQTRKPESRAPYRSMIHYAVRGRAHWPHFSGVFDLFGFRDNNQVAFVNTLIEEHGYTVHDVGPHLEMPLDAALEPGEHPYANVVQQLLGRNPSTGQRNGDDVLNMSESGSEDGTIPCYRNDLRPDTSYTWLHHLDHVDTKFKGENSSQGVEQVKIEEDTGSHGGVTLNPWVSESLAAKDFETRRTNRILSDTWDVMAELLKYGASLYTRPILDLSPVMYVARDAAENPSKRHSYVLLKFMLENRRGGTFPSRFLNRLLLFCIALGPEYREREAVCSLLFKYGASIHHRDYDLRKRLQNGFLIQDDVWLAKLCWKEGCLLNTPEQLFMEALHFRKLEVARYILAVSDKSIISTVGQNYDTALHLAAKQLDVELARLLIEAGADVNALNCYGETPLCSVVGTLSVARREPALQMVQFLLESHADPFGVECGYSCISTAKCVCEESRYHDFECHDGMSAFDRALDDNSPDLLKLMLQDNHLARQHPCIICGYIRKLCTQRRPFYSDLLGVLLRAGANPNGCGLCPGDPFVTYCVKEIRALLPMAHDTGHLNGLLYFTKELVERGAAVDQPNSEGETAASVLAEVLSYVTTNKLKISHPPFWMTITKRVSVGFDDSGRANAIYILSAPDEAGSGLFSNNEETIMSNLLKTT